VDNDITIEKGTAQPAGLGAFAIAVMQHTGDKCH
jgi:hypothetical protein